MELERARALLTELADGVDPLTGECLPPESVCNRPEIIRALHCVLQHTVQGADDLRPVADTLGRQALPRQRIDTVRKLRQQRPRAFQFHIPPLLSPPRRTAVKYPAPHKAPQVIARR